MLAILDYGAGNLTSVARALACLDVPCAITADSGKIAEADGVIFPGVGHATQAMERIRATGLDHELARAVAAGKPLLGICLGCQALLERCEEGPTETLGLISGQCRRFPPDMPDGQGGSLNIPHMGWNSLIRKKDSPLLAGIAPDAEFYFVHSYYADPDPELVIATTEYGREFCSVFGRDGLWATQFHPEKSGEAGLALLANFARWSHAFKTRDSMP